MAVEDKIEKLRIIIRRGDDTNRIFQVIDAAGIVIDITGYNAKFTVKEFTTDTFANAKITKSSATSTEIDINDPTNGKLTVFIKPIDTSSLAIKTYHYDLQVIDTGGKVFTTHKSTFSVLVDITDG